MRDTLTILTYETIAPFLEEEFSGFLGRWQLLDAISEGQRWLAIWKEVDRRRAFAVLMTDEAPERTLAAAQFPPRNYWGFLTPFLTGGETCWPGLEFKKNNAFAAVIFAEPEATRLRLVRHGEMLELPNMEGVFLISDIEHGEPIEYFDAVFLENRGWMPCVHDSVPYSPVHLAASYAAFQRAGDDEAVWRQHVWAYDLYEDLRGEDWLQAVVYMLAYGEDPDTMAAFGAHIYGNGHRYYDRMDKELAAGTIRPDNLAIVLGMERPEFLRDDVARRHAKLLRDAEYAASRQVSSQNR